MLVTSDVGVRVRRRCTPTVTVTSAIITGVLVQFVIISYSVFQKHQSCIALFISLYYFEKMMFLMVVVVSFVAQMNVEAFSLSRFSVQRSPITRANSLQQLSMSSEPTMIKVTEIFLTPKEEESIEPPNYDNESEEERYKRTKLAEIAEKQALDVFVSRNTGKWECQSCGYIYSEEKGNEKYNIKAGTPFDQIDKFRCPQV